MINRVVVDVITATRARIAAAAPRDIDDVRRQSASLVAMSDAVRVEHRELKNFLNEHLYRHERVLGMTTKSRRVLRELFAAFLADVDLLPAEHRAAALEAELKLGAAGRARVVADYVAGMTDRFALGEHQRLL